ncbi:hypothetical protein PPL_00753 [Heterostelium album PN500]|uniref:Uncharacterized protein n=1 Tax=Heterostelium pallidum (strain ATCC 26659 / Pp 5 / PN500) TaxID=670386 RepID=D3AXC2_HETP5|nr:hypothetical protein PPL_00753 [Heterostelium album PN500]EFA86191.1 hypothetical protein PPL_00753 [Heterostelium album PN500]|eukprot:XP_020438296.1 hypothetical protein PPL_00753 [Heterostelium album PN500]
MSDSKVEKSLPKIILFKILDYFVAECVSLRDEIRLTSDTNPDVLCQNYQDWIIELATVSKLFHTGVRTSIANRTAIRLTMDDYDYIDKDNEENKLEFYGTATHLIAEDDYFEPFKSVRSFKSIFGSVKKLSLHYEEVFFLEKEEGVEKKIKKNTKRKEVVKDSVDSGVKSDNILSLESLVVRDMYIANNTYNYEKFACLDTSALKHLSLDFITDGCDELMDDMFSFIFAEPFLGLNSLELTGFDVDRVKQPFVSKFFKLLSKFTELKRFKLNHNFRSKFNGVFVKELVKFLGQQNTLECFDYSSECHIPRGHEYLETLFKKGSSINELDIIANYNLPLLDRVLDRLHLYNIDHHHRNSDEPLESMVLPKSVKSLQVDFEVTFQQLAELLKDNDITEILRVVVHVHPTLNKIKSLDQFVKNLQSNKTLQRIYIQLRSTFEGDDEYDDYCDPEDAYKNNLIEKLDGVIQKHPTIRNKNNWVNHIDIKTINDYYH